MKSPTFLVIRLLVIFWSILDTLFNSSRNYGEFDKNWDKYTILFGLIMFLIIFVFIIVIMSITLLTSSTPKYYAPSWYRNPFTVKQILQLWHFGAWIIFSIGLARFVEYYISHKQYSGVGFISIMCGLGVLLSLNLSTILFKKKFIE